MSEFYSANLATEVKKGLLQKAKSGGGITRAPVGYRNVRETVTGRSIAMVVIDEQMAPLVRLVFNLYATGDYSITRITACWTSVAFGFSTTSSCQRSRFRVPLWRQCSRTSSTRESSRMRAWSTKDSTRR